MKIVILPNMNSLNYRNELIRCIERKSPKNIAEITKQYSRFYKGNFFNYTKEEMENGRLLLNQLIDVIISCYTKSDVKINILEELIKNMFLFVFIS